MGACGYSMGRASLGFFGPVNEKNYKDFDSFGFRYLLYTLTH